MSDSTNQAESELQSKDQDFFFQLRRQLHFISNSARLFDAGDIEEAIRIATCTRVLFRDTDSKRAKGGSVSLLTRLGSDRLRIASVISDEVRRSLRPDPLRLRAVLATMGGPARLNPITDFNWGYALRRWRDWWTDTIGYIEETPYSRQLIVGWAADKDGGAHVDPTVPGEYELLGQFGYKTEHVKLGLSLEYAHYVALRTIAFEILNSQELVALVQAVTSSRK